MNILDKIKNLRVAVIGDMMIDETIAGGSTRMSPEAPVPVMDIAGRKLAPGGAANVAMNAAALGAKVTLFTIPGDDPDAGKLVNRMRLMGVATLFDNRIAKSIRKSRVVVNGQQLLRMDSGSKSADPLDFSGANLQDFDLVILSDYGYGALSQELVDSFPKERTYTLVADPKPRSGIKFHDVDIITPNLDELRDLEPGWWDDDVMALTLRRDWNVGAVVATRGEEDTLVAYGPSVAYIPTEEITAVDPCGAGDTFVAAISCATAVGASILVATSFANRVAAIAVERQGTHAVSADEIRATQRFQHQAG